MDSEMLSFSASRPMMMIDNSKESKGKEAFRFVAVRVCGCCCACNNAFRSLSNNKKLS